MASTFAIVVLILLSCTQAARVAAFSLTISPDHIRIPTGQPRSVTITCNANVSLTGCQFTWISLGGNVGPILELHRGQYSRTNPAHFSSGHLTGYSYSGRGLAAGDCGVTLQIQNWNVWMVACRVQVRGGSWNYAWMDLFADGYKEGWSLDFAFGPVTWHNPPNKVTSREVVVVPGGVAKLAVKSTDPLTECRFWLPGASSPVTLDLGAASPNLTARHTYLGTGLQDGECGLALANVSETDNGPVVCKIRKIQPDADDYRFIPLIVASPPSAPVFHFTQEGADVTATCRVGTSRPVANITWFLGDDIIRRDSLDDSPGDAGDEWRWPWMQGSIAQNVSLKLKPEDNGKLLECVVSHVALAKPFEVNHKILFTAMSSDEVREQEAADAAKEMAKLNLEAARSSARAEESKAKAAELVIEAARSSARAEEARAKNEEARTREEVAWAKNAEEELQFERDRRGQSLQQPQSPQSAQS